MQQLLQCTGPLNQYSVTPLLRQSGHNGIWSHLLPHLWPASVSRRSSCHDKDTYVSTFCQLHFSVWLTFLHLFHHKDILPHLVKCIPSFNVYFHTTRPTAAPALPLCEMAHVWLHITAERAPRAGETAWHARHKSKKIKPLCRFEFKRIKGSCRFAVPSQLYTTLNS